MEFLETENLALELMTAFRLEGWRFGWNRRKRSLGLCRYHERRIELSVHFVSRNGVAEVRETILHEIAHALAGEKAGHGPLWKVACARVGCKPRRCDRGMAQMPQGKWSGRCLACGREYSRHRRPHKQARYWCRGCGPARGKIIFNAAIVSHPSAAVPT